MQLTGCHNGNEKRNATCAASETSEASTQDALLFISYSMLNILNDVKNLNEFLQSCTVPTINLVPRLFSPMEEQRAWVRGCTSQPASSPALNWCL